MSVIQLLSLFLQDELKHLLTVALTCQWLPVVLWLLYAQLLQVLVAFMDETCHSCA